MDGSTFADLIDGGSSTPALELASLVVPPRFAGARFETYRPDPAYPSQAAALTRISSAVQELRASNPSGSGLLQRLRRRPVPGWSGLYLDGGFGVGKTHLLAAAWHAADGLKRAYFSFQELTYVVGAFGMARALDVLGAADLICLDEFELDDPGNTMLATSFVREVLERGARVIATSNTLPNELGRGRFSADMFQREIGQLAASFASVRIDGEDFRHRRFSGDATLIRLLPRSTVAIDAEVPDLPWNELLPGLAAVHPIHYARIVAALPGIWLREVEPLPNQDTALRFVHFADKLYDYRIPLVISGAVSLDTLFPSTIGYGQFGRKFRRCQSRLFEMLSEPVSASIPAAAADD
jgi:cell division protein ZapE